jgi:hypothetical protein
MNRLHAIATSVLLFVLPGAARTEDPKPLLPAEAVWSMRYDDKLDGEVTGKPADAVRWMFTVRNDRIAGSLAGLKAGDPSDHRIAGEVVAGKPAIVMLRQDGPRGLVCYYTGKRVDEGKIVGTWFDNRGKSGDFEMVIEK